MQTKSYIFSTTPALQAIQCLLGATEISPNDASVYSKLGLNYGKSGKLDSAMLAFDTALALDPNNAMARSNKAVALERMGKQEVCFLVAWILLTTLPLFLCRMQPRLGKRCCGRSAAIWTRTRCERCVITSALCLCAQITLLWAHAFLSDTTGALYKTSA